jgi:Flp pilus assembly protein TadD
LAQVGQVDEAIRELRLAVQYAPADARLHYLLGLQLEKQHMTEPAAAEYRTVLQIDPQHAQARARLAALGP